MVLSHALQRHALHHPSQLCLATSPGLDTILEKGAAVVGRRRLQKSTVARGHQTAGTAIRGYHGQPKELCRAAQALANWKVPSPRLLTGDGCVVTMKKSCRTAAPSFFWPSLACSCIEHAADNRLFKRFLRRAPNWLANRLACPSNFRDFASRAHNASRCCNVSALERLRQSSLAHSTHRLRRIYLFNAL
jgi:hypothetical protein